VARERESGTLEVLFYGPVGYTAYIMARFLEAMIADLLVIAMGVLYFLVMSAVTRFTFSAQTVSVLVLSIVVASCPITFGLCIATLTGRIRSAMLVFVATLLIFGLIPLADTLLTGVQLSTDSATVLVYVRTTIAILDQLLSWLSPYAYVSRLIQPQTEATLMGYVVVIVVAIIYSSVCLSLAIWSLRRRGVRK
jgi:ABC-type transport system involved in multi-copper enzyme maturation permease subunit